MQADIPIIVTRKPRPNEPTFRQAQPQLLERLRDARSPSLPKPRNTNLEPRHQTLDPNGPPTASRTRRISSSAAAKRFPKDFFKDENCLHPIKSIRTKHKQPDPAEPCFLDTFSHKNFLVCPEPDSDTPKFTNKADGTKGKGGNGKQQKEEGGERLRSKVDELIQETPVGKYHTASEQESKHPLLQIFEPQRQEAALGVPFISNFNVTLGQKVALSFLLKAQKSKRRKAEEKENNEECPSARRESNLKAQGFRIRKKMA